MASACRSLTELQPLRRRRHALLTESRPSFAPFSDPMLCSAPEIRPRPPALPARTAPSSAPPGTRHPKAFRISPLALSRGRGGRNGRRRPAAASHPWPVSPASRPASSLSGVSRTWGGELQKRLVSSHDAAKESNLPSRGLPGPASFEDWMGHQARAAPGVMLRLGVASGEPPATGPGARSRSFGWTTPAACSSRGRRSPGCTRRRTVRPAESRSSRRTCRRPRCRGCRTKRSRAGR